MTPDTIIFQTASKEMLRITKDGIIVPEGVSVDESAAGVIAALESYIVKMVQEAVTAEREECAKECERMMVYPRGLCAAPAHQDVWEAAKAIRAREQK